MNQDVNCIQTLDGRLLVGRYQHNLDRYFQVFIRQATTASPLSVFILTLN